MKRSLIILTLVFSSAIANSQIVFNKIIEDTVNHIPNTIIPIDTGYVMLSGTANEYNVRSFAFTYINTQGEKQWKKVYGSEESEYWEGKDNNLVKNNESYLFTGSYKDVYTNYRGIHYSIFDSIFNLESHTILLYDTIWRKSFNTLLTSSKEVFFTGQSYDYENSNYRLYLVKIDSNRNCVWEKSYGSLYEAGFQIIETTDKNILVGGLTFSFPVSNNDEDWYLIKVDTAGTVIWEKGFGNGSLYDGGVSGIIETQDSNYIACGGYPAFEIAGNSFFDGCLRKVSRDGVLMWTKYYRRYSIYPSDGPTTIDCKIVSILRMNNGDLMIIGNSYESYPRHRGFLMRLDSSGNIKWDRLYYAESESSAWQYLSAFKPTNDGGFILAGYGNEYDAFGYFPPQQAWLIKTDSLGIDGLCYTEPPALNIDLVLPETVNCNDTITVYAYIAGKSAPYTIETSIGQVIDNIYYPPVFVPVEIGLSQTSVEIGGIEYYSELITEATLSNHEWGQCIAKPVSFYTPHTSGTQQINITVTDAYGESKTITKEVFVNDNCGQSVAGVETCPVKLYPNPAGDIVYIDIPPDINPVNAEIYNSVGQLVDNPGIHSGLNVVNVPELPAGVYVLKIISNNKNYSLSFEKE